MRESLGARWKTGPGNNLKPVLHRKKKKEKKEKKNLIKPFQLIDKALKF